MDQLIDLALKMPPIVSAILSLMILVILYVLGRKVLTELGEIKEQTTKTNGSVRELKTWREAHDKQDDERHGENVKKLDAIFDKLDGQEGGSHV